VDKQCPQQLLDSMKMAGEILAPLYIEAVKWAKQHARHDIKIGLRDAWPIDHVAKKMHKANILDASKFSPVWLTRETRPSGTNSFGRSFWIGEYYKQENLNQPFTFLDVGFRDTIGSSFRSLGLDVQSLLVAADAHLAENLPDYAEVWGFQSLKTVLLRDLNFSAHAYKYFDENLTKGDNIKKNNQEFFRCVLCSTGTSNYMDGIKRYEVSFCNMILEGIPQQHKELGKYSTGGGLLAGGKWTPNVLKSAPHEMESFVAFGEGLDNGVDLIKGADTKMMNYLPLLIASTPQLFETWTKLCKQTPFCNPERSDKFYMSTKMPHDSFDRMTEAKNNIAEVYRG